MPHLKFKEIPLYSEPPPDQPGPRHRVGTAVIIHHDQNSVDFFVRIDDPNHIKSIRDSILEGAFFQVNQSEFHDDDDIRVHKADLFVTKNPIPEQQRGNVYSVEVSEVNPAQ